MEESKQCRNCRHFVKHYVGNSNITFVFADNVCTKKMPVYAKEEHYCGYWERKNEKSEKGTVAILGNWVSAISIEEAPTVKAIPIEWIKNWMAKSVNTYNREQVYEMLEDWEKENECRGTDKSN